MRSPDGDDPAALVAGYQELAEQFVMGTHADIDGLQDDPPRCLVELVFSF